MSAIEPPAAPKSNTGKIVGCVGCGCLTLVLGIAAAVVIGVFGIRKMATESDAFRDSIAAIAANPAATEALGSPVEPGFMGEVSINYDNGNQSINLSFPVSGPEGKGTLRVVGSKPAGAPKWEYSTWQLDIDGGESIPLGQ